MERRGRKTIHIQTRGCQTSPLKRQTVNTLGFVDETVSVATTHLCCHSAEAAIANTETNEFGCIPKKKNPKTHNFMDPEILISCNFHIS